MLPALALLMLILHVTLFMSYDGYALMLSRHITPL